MKLTELKVQSFVTSKETETNQATHPKPFCKQMSANPNLVC